MAMEMRADGGAQRSRSARVDVSSERAAAMDVIQFDSYSSMGCDN